MRADQGVSFPQSDHRLRCLRVILLTIYLASPRTRPISVESGGVLETGMELFVSSRLATPPTLHTGGLTVERGAKTSIPGPTMSSAPVGRRDGGRDNGEPPQDDPYTGK